jgi:hypothetical protein
VAAKAVAAAARTMRERIRSQGPLSDDEISPAKVYAFVLVQRKEEQENNN